MTCNRPDIHLALMDTQGVPYVDLSSMPVGQDGHPLPFFHFRKDEPPKGTFLEITLEQQTQALQRACAMHGIWLWVEDPTVRICPDAIAWVPAKVAGQFGWFGFEFVRFVLYTKALIDAPDLSVLPNRTPKAKDR